MERTNEEGGEAREGEGRGERDEGLPAIIAVLASK